MRSTKRLANLALAAAIMLPAMSLSADDFGPRPDLPMDESLWVTSGGSFECRVTLPMAEFGTLEIHQLAGDPLNTIYRPVRESRNKTAVKWINAPWSEDEDGQAYGMKSVKSGFILGTHNTKHLMDALDEGHWTSIRFNGNDLLIPSIRWAEAANDFHECRKTISPLSIAQARDQNLYYESGQRTISEDHLEMIEDTAEYIDHDPEFSKILVDSYTDLAGNRLRNLQISRERTADVVAALKEAGVNGDLIEGRAHGERLTVQKDNSEESRDRARKVTLRVIRGLVEEQNDMPELVGGDVEQSISGQLNINTPSESTQNRMNQE